MRLEITKAIFHSSASAKVVNGDALKYRSGFVIACLALFVAEGCTLIQGVPISSVPVATNSQPGTAETSITPQQPFGPPARPKVSAKENSTAAAKLLQTGKASWYGPQFQGKITASGDTFNQRAFTAAHPTLPFGSKVKVTNLANGKSVEVKINDRGPLLENRIIDVSRAAAEVLEMKESGTTTVRLELLSGE
jgi:rare lipoprotein A (peptidoglycan hydrolase)